MTTLDMHWYEDTRYIVEYEDAYYYIAYVSIRQHTLAHAYTALPAYLVEYEDARFIVV
jgi:hypothetical protein